MDTDKTTPRVWISTADFAELVDIHEVTIRRLRTLDGGPFQQGRDFRRIGAKGFRIQWHADNAQQSLCLLYTSPSPRDMRRSRMPSSA